MVQVQATNIVRKISKAEATTIDAAEGIVEAFVNTMGVVDYDGEIIEIDAFSDSILKGGQTVAWFHDQSTPVGKVLDASPIPYGDDEETVLRGASPNTQTITSKSASDALDNEEVVDDASDTEAELVREGIEITKIQLTLETNKDG